MTSKAQLVAGSSLSISTEKHTDVSTAPLQTAMESMDCSARTVAWQSGGTDEIETTVLCSTAKEFLMGLSDAGSFTVSGFWKQGDPAQKVCKDASKDKQTRYVKMTFADGSTFASLAYVSGRSWSAAVNGSVEGEWTFRCTGETVETEPTP